MAGSPFQGVLPATVTPFTEDGELDVAALESYTRWMESIPGVTGLVVNGHAGEGTSLTRQERAEVIRRTKAVLGDRLPVIAGVGGDGSRVIAEEAAEAARAGADALLVFPAGSWLRFGYQEGAPQDRYRAVHAASGLPMSLFNVPDETHATYNLDTILSLCELDGVVAIKDGARSMIRWDTELPVIRQRFPGLPVLTCQDEFLLHTMWEADGALVGYGALVPDLMVDLLAKAQRHDYDAAKAAYERMAPLTKVVYHRRSHIESTPVMKLGLVARGVLPGATVRPPLMPLDGLVAQEVSAALKAAGIETVA
jgi:4-hydroxy-tetrahydrodipicolinate synthase